VSYSKPSVSGVILQEKEFEFDRLRNAVQYVALCIMVLMNRVHPPSDSQTDVFSELQPLIVSLLDGLAH
jgi:hypothetical protein